MTAAPETSRASRYVSTTPISRYELCSRLMMEEPPETRRPPEELEDIIAKLQQGAWAPRQPRRAIFAANCAALR